MILDEVKVSFMNNFRYIYIINEKKEINFSTLRILAIFLKNACHDQNAKFSPAIRHVLTFFKKKKIIFFHLEPNATKLGGVTIENRKS